MSEPKLSEAGLLNIMAAVRHELQEEAASYQAPIGAPHLTFTRGRELALNATRWLEAERAHVATCRSCANLVKGFEQQIPHPGFWDILRWHLGRQGEDARQWMRYHIEDGMCQLCQERLKKLKNIPWPAQPARLRHPDAIRTEGPSIRLDALSLDERLSGTLRATEDSLRFVARTEDEELNHHLVRYEIQAESDQIVIGYLPLQTDEDGWYAMRVVFTLHEAYPSLSGGIMGILIDHAPIETLTDMDWAILLASVEHDILDAETGKAWQAWVKTTSRQHSLSETVRQRIEDVKERLGA